LRFAAFHPDQLLPCIIHEIASASNISYEKDLDPANPTSKASILDQYEHRLSEITAENAALKHRTAEAHSEIQGIFADLVAAKHQILDYRYLQFFCASLSLPECQPMRVISGDEWRP